MNANNSITTLLRENTSQEAILNDFKKISDAVNDSEKVSKEKYETKLKLIKSSTDMSTQEKLDAIDKNCDCRDQEHRQNILTFAIVFISFSILKFAIRSSADTKRCAN